MSPCKAARLRYRVRQLVEFDPLFRRQQQDLEVQHPLAAGARQRALLPLGGQQRIEQSLIVDLELVTAAPLMDQVARARSGSPRRHRAGGNIETAGQLLLWQRLGVKQGEQLLESGVGQLGHEGEDSCRAWWVDVNKGVINKPGTAQ
jgi:hypothetical protein